jgi:hypothetical protein
MLDGRIKSSCVNFPFHFLCSKILMENKYKSLLSARIFNWIGKEESKEHKHKLGFDI